MRPRAVRIGATLAAVVLASACGADAVRPSPAGSMLEPIRIGAVFPIEGNTAPLAKAELAGVQIAVDLINADGGIAGRRVVLDVRDLESRSDAPAAMSVLKADGVNVVIGAYASDLSIAASAAADAAGLVYWEAGAVADRLTGRGLPMVFRVGASGTNLGSSSARFAAAELAPRLGRTAAQLRLAIVAADDAYARSVADAATATANLAGVPITSRTTYNVAIPDWPRVMTELKAARPDVIVLASHIPDGIAFRKAMLAYGLRVAALIGSTMAECDPDFAGELGADAIGIFASDRPTAGFRPGALQPDARLTYERFVAAWASRNHPGEADTGGTNGSATQYGDSEYALSGPAESPSAEATEEALAGFSATWALLRAVLPVAERGSSAEGAGQPGPLSPATIAAAARQIDLPEGALPNGAGLRFSTNPASLGQNERATAVIWQWQAERSYAFVWPPSYATGTIEFVPLPR